jgi:hypothetical protein
VPLRSELRLEDGKGDRATEGVDDVGFEGIGLEAECEPEEEGSAWLTAVGEEREKRLRKRRSRPWHNASLSCKAGVSPPSDGVLLSDFTPRRR